MSLDNGLRGVSTEDYAKTSSATYTCVEWGVLLPDKDLAFFGDSDMSQRQAEHYAKQMLGRVLTRTVTVTVPAWDYADDPTPMEG